MEPNDYIDIEISSFVGGSKAIVDLYVRLADNHFTKIVNAGAFFDIERLKKLQDKEVTHLYIAKKDYAIFAEASNKISEILATKSPISNEQKMAVLIRTAGHVFTELAEIGVDQASYSHAVQVCQNSMTIIEKNPEVVDVLGELSKFNNYFVRHSVGTSVMSVMLAKSLTWNSQKTLNAASLGGFLHDVGMKGLSLDLLTKSVADMSKEELELYQSHPARGLLILKDMQDVPAEILSIVSDHHELPSGTGFPRGIKEDKIFPLSRAVAFADKLASLILTADSTGVTRDFKSAVDIMLHTMKHDFPPIYFEAALKLVAQQGQVKKSA